MFKFLSIATIVVTAGLSFGCGGGAPANSKSNLNANSAAGGMVTVDPANLPEGISTSSVPPSANTTPGIPAANTVLPKGATPTPGIPSEAELKRGIKPGVTPTPGIPSPEELKRQMSRPANMSAPPPNPGTDAPMMKSTNKVPRKPQ